MRPARRLSLAVLCAVPIALGAAPVAHAVSDFEKVATVYIQKGAIPPCQFTPKQLTTAKTTIPADYDQYAPDFKDAIDAALKARAAGACEKTPGKKATDVVPAVVAPTTGGPAAPGPAAAAGEQPAPAKAGAATTAAVPAKPTPQPTPAVRPAPAVADGAILAAATTGGDSDVPAPLVALGLLALLSALAAAAVFGSRWLAFEPGWVVRSRHATAEAGWRTSAAWAEFRDWLRIGR